MNRAGRTLISWAVVALAAAGTLLAPAPARGDEYLDRVNDYFKNVQPSQHLEKTLYPRLAKMPSPPGLADTPLKAALLPANAEGFKPVAQWLSQPECAAVLEDLQRINSDKDYKTALTLAQPYGASAVDPETVMSGLYTELGDPPLLAGAKFGYLPKLSEAFCLLHAQATKLASEGKVNDAARTVLSALYLGRTLGDREFLTEQNLGYDMMLLAFMRLRDVAYTDMLSGDPKLKPEEIRALINRLDERTLLGLDRLRLPRGDAIGIEQLVEYVFIKDGPVSSERFAPTMARLTTGSRPLRLFSETAKWETIGSLHAGEKETLKSLRNVYNGWANRWSQDPFAALLRTSSDYQKLDKTRFAVLDAIIGDLGKLFPLRQQLRVELAGTRTSLGVYGYRRINAGKLPPDVTSIRPDFVIKIDSDPLDPRKAPALSYIVPGHVNSQQSTHEVRVIPEILGIKYPNFAASYTDEQFLIYSVGPDGVPNAARLATQMARDDKGDYLLWPPMLALVRQNQVESGKIK